MKTYLLVVLLLLIAPILYSQNIALKLSNGLDKLVLKQTSEGEAKRIFGKPDSIYGNEYRTDLFYKNLGMNLCFEKAFKNKLWKITLQDSPVIINDSIRLNRSDTSAVVRWLGKQGNRGFLDIDLYYCYTTPEIPYAFFYFNKSGELFRVELETPLNNISCE